MSRILPTTMALLALCAACSDNAPQEARPEPQPPTDAPAAPGVVTPPSVQPIARAVEAPGVNLLPLPGSPTTTLGGGAQTGPQQVLVVNAAPIAVTATLPGTTIAVNESQTVQAGGSAVFGPYDLHAYSRIRVLYGGINGYCDFRLIPHLMFPDGLHAQALDNLNATPCVGTSIIELPGTMRFMLVGGTSGASTVSLTVLGDVR
jgi:hypothetical protein